MTLPVRWHRTVRDAFKRWVRSQDAQEVLAASSPQAWLSAALVIPAVLGLATWAPGADRLFDLPFGKAMGYLAPCLALGITFALLHRGRQRLEWWGWLYLLPGVTTLHFFM
ncbi:MAG: sensor histidine kinase, partial [Archangium sp.]